MAKFSIGSDTEYFAKDKKTGEHVALCGKIGGSKESPLQLENMPEGFMVQEDNVSIEWNIPAATYKNYFEQHVRAVRERVASLLDTMGLEISNLSSVSFDKKELTHPNALVFGCEPDYDAWTKRENKKPYATDETLRTAGGHIHVGSQDVDMLTGVRMMDLFLGVPSVILDDSSAAIKRKELYGKAGAMRPKPYGWEYRVLSNYWTLEDYLTSWVYDNTTAALNRAKKIELSKEESLLIQQCINTNDKALAEQLINKYTITMPNKSKSKAPKLQLNTANLTPTWAPTPIGFYITTPA